MSAWRYKSCPRCGGDIFLEKDEYDWNEHCLQCGFEHELKTLEEFSKQEAKKKVMANNRTK
jgi:ribosomal protein L37E